MPPGMNRRLASSHICFRCVILLTHTEVNVTPLLFLLSFQSATAGDFDAADDPDEAPRTPVEPDDGGAAVHSDVAEPESCSIGVPVFGTPGHVWMEWTYDQEGFVLPELQVYPLEEDG